MSSIYRAIINRIFQISFQRRAFKCITKYDRNLSCTKHILYVLLALIRVQVVYERRGQQHNKKEAKHQTND